MNSILLTKRSRTSPSVDSLAIHPKTLLLHDSVFGFMDRASMANADENATEITEHSSNIGESIREHALKNAVHISDSAQVHVFSLNNNESCENDVDSGFIPMNHNRMHEQTQQQSDVSVAGNISDNNNCVSARYNQVNSNHNNPVNNCNIDLNDGRSFAPEELMGRFELLEYLGCGSYGHVHRARNLLNGKIVAIKKVCKAFDNLTNAKRLLREIKILRMLDEHVNVIHFSGLLRPLSNRFSEFNNLSMVFEFVDTDLAKLIHSHQTFSDQHVQYFLYQIMCGLQYIHSANVIHRDLKPANVLVNQDCSLKICDFGLSRSTELPSQSHPLFSMDSPIVKRRTLNNGVHVASSRARGGSLSGLSHATEDVSFPLADGRGKKRASRETEAFLPDAFSLSPSHEVPGHLMSLPPPSPLKRELTKHVVTRWYRAPELILLHNQYTAAIDLWSAGCILAEMLSMQQHPNPRDRTPLFPGRSCFPLSADNEHAYTNTQDQLNVIFDVIGTPSEESVAKIDNDSSRAYLRSLPKKHGIDLYAKYHGCNILAVDLLRRLLAFDSSKRYTARQALKHPYLKPIADEHADKLYIPRPDRPLPNFDFEDRPLTRDQIKQLVLAEVLLDSPHPLFSLSSS